MKNNCPSLVFIFFGESPERFPAFHFVQHWSRIHEGLPADTPLHDRSLIIINAQECDGFFSFSEQTRSFQNSMFD
jgi:hypothetical protein